MLKKKILILDYETIFYNNLVNNEKKTVKKGVGV